jgi:hypothetical protein
MLKPYQVMVYTMNELWYGYSTCATKLRMILTLLWGWPKTIAGSDARVLVGKLMVWAEKISPNVHQDQYYKRLKCRCCRRCRRRRRRHRRPRRCRCVSTVNSTYVAISAILLFCHSFCRTAIPAIPAIQPFRLPFNSAIPSAVPPFPPLFLLRLAEELHHLSLPSSRSYYRRIREE